MLELLKKCKITLAYMALKSKKYEDQNKVIELIKEIDKVIAKSKKNIEYVEKSEGEKKSFWLDGIHYIHKDNTWRN